MDCSPPGSSVHGILQARIQSGLLCPPPGNLPNSEIKPTAAVSPALAGRLFTTVNNFQFSSVAQSCLTLCDPMNRSTPGFPVHRQLLDIFAAAAAKSLQSCPTLCDPIDGSPLGSSVPGILQARTLEWVAISFSNA